MINCSKTEIYFKEKARMTKATENDCFIECADCPLSGDNNGYNIFCNIFESKYPNEAIVAVQKWSDEHSQKTIIQDFLEKYPNAPLNVNGIPTGICPHELGYEEIKKCTTCVSCWNRLLDEIQKEGQ